LLEGCRESGFLPRRKKLTALGLCLSFALEGALGMGRASLAAVSEAPVPVTNIFSVDIRNRSAVRTFFNAIYSSGAGVRSGWNGTVTNCEAGSTSSEFQEAVRTRINFFRAMAGVPADVRFDPVLSAKAQKGALMVSANASISHDPADLVTCFSPDGAAAAAVSNLALGTSGTDSIEAYMLDAGSNYRVGHRRWLLYPQTRVMGTGDIDPPDGSTERRANANWVIDENLWAERPETRDGFVAWPPPGFVPYKIVYPRWSFSFPNADFTNATVSVTTNGVPLSIHLEKVERGYGENTIVFVPGEISPETRTTAAKPDRDITYDVMISGANVAGARTNFSYSVIIFDPETTDESPTLSGPSEPELGRKNRFLAAAVENASGYDFRFGTLTPFGSVEAGDSIPDVSANISTLYPLVQTNIFASSNAAFHLAHTTPARPQTLALNRYIVSSDRSELRFQSRLGAASTGQVARVQVSLDDGSSWREVYSQAGNGLSGEHSFGVRRIGLGEFAGRAIQIRFEYGFRFGEFNYAPGSGEQIGWYIDDIAVTFADELTILGNATREKPEFSFLPEGAGNYYIDARPRLFGGFKGEWAAGKIVTAVQAPSVPAEVRVVGIRAGSTGLEVEFEPVNARPTALYRLESASDAGGEWSVVDPGSLLETQLGSRRLFRLPAMKGLEFFRVTIE
jgi:hypothetical protein